MNHKKTLRLITDYFAGELSAPVSEQLMAHLEACETCRKEFEEFDELWSRTGEVLAEDSTIEQLSDERKDFIATAKALAAKTKKKSPTVTRRIIEYGAVAAILLIFAGMLLPALNSARSNGVMRSARNEAEYKRMETTMVDIADDKMTEGADSGGEAKEESTARALKIYRDGLAKQSGVRSRNRRTEFAETPIVLSGTVAKKTVRKQVKTKWAAGFEAADRDDTFGGDSNQFSARRSAPTLKQTDERLFVARRSAPTLGKDAKNEVLPMELKESLASGEARHKYALSKRKKSKANELQLAAQKPQSSSLRHPGAKSPQKIIMEKRLNQSSKSLVKADAVESNRFMGKIVVDRAEKKGLLRETESYADKEKSNKKRQRRIPVQRKVFKLNLKLWNITTVQNLRVLMQQRGYPLTARVSINRHDNTLTFYDTSANLMKAATLFSKLQAAEKELKDFRNGIPMLKTKLRPVSTFSIDTDTASYVQAKRMIMNGQRPDPMKIREEEFVNYFDYHYRSPKKTVFGVYLEAAPAPFRSGKVLLRIGVQGKKLGPNSGTVSSYTILFDGSGSMAAGNRLELAFQTMQLLFNRLSVNDRVSLIVCNEQPGLLFVGRRGGSKASLFQQLKRIKPAGAADFSAGLSLAYRTAMRNYLPGGINKVVIISDGIVKLPKAQLSEVMNEIDRSRRRGISNIVIGVGGDGDDQLLEKLAAAGDGSYVFIDRSKDAVELFNQQFDARFREIARDVKIQVEFNAAAVPEYRQIGYRNRQLSKADFRNDKINAGEVGSGQSVTALYEMKLNRELPAKMMLAIVRLRYKPIDSDEVIEEEFVITSNEVDRSFATATPGFKLATFVAEFAESLRYPETPGIASGSGVAAKLSPLFHRNFSNDGKVAELLMLTRKVK
ncbi:MAG: von Willebrand factor type A domain-containing protein [Victivallaceae bacterium]|nr:von Willebrand factor type A domain-containing protein [Victivallaceae bacterium]